MHDKLQDAITELYKKKKELIFAIAEGRGTALVIRELIDAEAALIILERDKRYS
jgi:hypothetical protein